jgi:uncharacterized protein with ParB-like and HNH nuclease domain
MKAHETILQPVLEGTKQYIVPLFQRTYSWKSDNWKTLWDDLLSLYSSESARKHFLGALVSMPVDMTPAGVNKFLLIDGQQRITTLFLILAAIRDIATARNEGNLADQINELYLTNKWAEGTNILKLFPSQTDREQFSKIIHRKDDLDGNNNAVKAFKYLKSKLEGKDPSGKSIDLKRMHTILVQEIMIVNIVLDKDENPYLIFESLNAKGEPLTQADLVRNYILMRITNAEEQEVAYRDFWMPMQNALGSELTGFIWRYLIKDTNSAKVIRLDEIYDEVKEILAKAKPSQVVDLLVDMHTFSEYYLALINPDDSEPNKEIRKRLKRLIRWDVKTTYPFLLNVYRDYKEKKISDQSFCDVLDILESYVVRRSFCRIPTNALNKIFLGLYKSFDVRMPAKSISNDLIQRDWPGDTAFLNAWIYFPIYLSGTAKCRHILESLESEMTLNKEPVDLTNAQISIEHIMPQTLNEEWEQLLGEKAVETYDTYLHTIGNLTLTGSNSDLGNQSLLEKKKIYSKSNFTLNKELTDVIIWGEYFIKQRAQRLGKVAIEIWKHPDETAKATEGDVNINQDPTGKKPTGFSLFGTEYQIDSWRDMMLTILGELAARHGSEFDEKAVQVKTSRRVHIARQPDNMITPMKIPGTDLWVEANQSSRSVLWVIDQTLATLGDKEEDFEAYW